MPRDWYTAAEVRDLEALDPCPYWARMNPTGWCVDRWWAGGPLSAAINGLVLAASMAALGGALAYAAKMEFLKPAATFFQKAQQQAGLLGRNRRRTRRQLSRGR